MKVHRQAILLSNSQSDKSDEFLVKRGSHTLTPSYVGERVSLPFWGHGEGGISMNTTILEDINDGKEAMKTLTKPVDQKPRPRYEELSAEAFRARRYRDAEHVIPLTDYPTKNRISVNGVDAAWESTGWSNSFEDRFINVKIQHHRLSLYKNGEPIGIAKFNGLLFNDHLGMWQFVDVADTVSQDWYELSVGVKSVLEHLCGGSIRFEPGMRIIEFKLLVMRSAYADTSKWVAPVTEFIRRKFRNTSRAWNHSLVLRPFPLEYRGATEIGMVDDGKLKQRRRAMVRHYQRTLGVELAVPETADDWWMGRLL